MPENVEIVSINSDNIWDRLKLCWGHFQNWQTLEIVRKSREWLEKTNMSFAPTTFVAYKNAVPIGMIEFLPQKLLPKSELCPCRIDIQHGEIPERYSLGEQFENHLFISCLSVNQQSQGKGVGSALLSHFLRSEVLKRFDGAIVYVTKREETWAESIHWPAGPKEFYQKTGFALKKTLDNPTGYLLVLQKG